MNLEELIAERPQSRSELRAWYSSLFAQAAEEQVEVPALASRLGCTATNLYRHRSQTRSAPVASPKLVQATVAPASEAGSPLIEIRLSGGRTVAVSSGFDPVALRAVLEVADQC